MNPFPLHIGAHAVPSAEALRDLFVEHARGGPLRRQDEDATPVWRAAMEASPIVDEAVQTLVVAVIADEEDLTVLDFALALGKPGEAFSEAAARRVLDGPSIVEGSLQGKVLEHLRFRADFVRDPKLKKRLMKASTPGELLDMSLNKDGTAYVDAFEAAAAAGDVSESQARQVGIRVVRNHPDQLERVVTALRALSPAHQATFVEWAAKVKPDQRAAIEALLR